MKSNRISRVIVAAAALVTASLALTACFSGGGATTSPSGEGGDARISLAMLQPPRSGLSPLSDDATKLSRWSTTETLVALDADGQVQPLLATEWTEVDDVTWDFTIREGVTFHDGTEMTTASVVNSFEKALAATPRPRVLDGVDMTVTATDENTVRFVLGAPDPILPQRLSSPQLVVLSAAAYGADGTVTPKGTGTGPFVLADIGGTSTATLNRFDGYWGDKAKAAGIDVTYVNDGGARGAALRTGAADIVEAVPVSQLALLDPNLLHEVSMPRTTSLYFNNAEGVFADPAMRAAARAALDPEAIVQAVYEGNADAAKGIFGPAITWADKLRGDVASAVAPAAPAGATVTLATYSDRAELPEVAVVVEQQLEKAGFTVEQDVREYANFEQDAMAGAFDIVLASRATQLETGDPVSFLTSDFTCDGTGFVFAQVCDSTLDGLIATASGATPGEERQQDVMAVESYMLQRDMIAPLLHERVVQGEAAGVTDAVRDPIERRLITNMTAVAK